MAGKIGGNWQFIYLSSWKSPGFEINDIGYMLMADMHMGVGVINYNIYKPFSVFRSMSFGTNLIHLMDFGGHTNAVAVSQSWTANYQNQWRTFLSGQLTSPETDNHLLRGGPAMKMPGQLYLSASIDSDWRKKLSGEVDFSVTRTFNDVMTSYELSFELEYRPFNTLTLNIEPGWSRTVNMMQYVTFRHLEGLNDQSERYIFGSIDQKIYSISIRADFNITPDLTIQYWGQPFFGSGDYSEFKRITDPVAASLDGRYEMLDGGVITYAIKDRKYSIDENLDKSPDYNFSNPDFTVSEFLHNLVVRWEFLPGSTAYLVWSQSRDYNTDDGRFSLSRQSYDLFNATKAHNIFLVKFSYRFGLR